jgi:hypothetical protein
MSQNFNERKELPLPVYPRDGRFLRKPATEIAHVIVKYDDTGIQSYWTGQSDWAWSIEHDAAIRFARQHDAWIVLNQVVLPSEGAQYPNDQIRVEEHLWTCDNPGVSKK